MKANPLPITNIFAPRLRYCVPIFQRHYVWNLEDQWEPLWEDISAKAAARIQEREDVTPHYVGAVVLEARKQASVQNVPVYNVIDGQQRLVTFQIILAALRDFAMERESIPEVAALDRQLKNPDPELMEEPEVEVFKVWPTQHDRTLFSDIISLGSRNELVKKYSEYCIVKENRLRKIGFRPALLQAYFYFYDAISEFIEDEGDDSGLSTNVPNEKRLNVLYNSFMNDFRVVEIQLDTEDDAQVIFETLNARGTPLTAPDLLRNYIFMRAEENAENPNQLYEEYWTEFEDHFWAAITKQGRFNRTRLEFFVINFLTCKVKTEVNQSKIYPEYKSFIRHKKPYGSVAQELEDLVAYSKLYSLLVSPSGEGSDVAFAKALKAWDITTVYPLVIEILARCDDENERRKIFSHLQSYIVRRAVCNLTTKNYNKIFLQVLGNLDEAGFSCQALQDELMKFGGDSTVWPDNDRFQRAWRESEIYSRIPSSRIREILMRVEEYERNKFSEKVVIKSALTIEHVMPVNWEEHWPLSDGTVVDNDLFRQSRFYLYLESDVDPRFSEINQRETMYHTIGNLTLLTKPLNSSVSNGPYKKKRQAIIKQSALRLNRYFQDFEDWNEDAILKRSDHLFKSALKIWPYPSS